MSKIQTINTTQIKKATGLSDTQITEVTKAMNNYNKLQEEIKDGTLESTKNTTTTNTAKEVEKNESSTLEKVASWVGEFGSVRASAGWCSFSSSASIGWSGVYIGLNKCAQNWAIGVSAVTFGIWFIGLVACAGSTAGLCGWLFGGFTTFAIRSIQIIYGVANNRNCQWATLKLSYPLFGASISC